MFFLALMGCWGASAAMAGDLQVATVDMATLFKEYPGTVQAQEKFDAFVRKKKKALAGSQDVLTDLQAEMRGKLSYREKKLKEKLFADETQRYEDEKNQVQRDLEGRNEKITAILVGQIKAIVAQVAQNEGFNLVLDSDMVANPRAEADLTQEVLEKFARLKPAITDVDSALKTTLEDGS